MKLNIQLFASGTIEFTDNDDYIRGKIEWSSEVDGSTIEEKATRNRSKVTASIYVRRTTGSTTGRQWNGYINIGGDRYDYYKTQSGSSVTVGTSWVYIDRYITYVNHNSDGTKTIAISGEVSGPSGTSLSGKSSTGSGSVTLEAIPRASTPTFSPSTAILGQNVTITTNRYSNNYTNNITYTIGETTGTIVNGAADTLIWTPPLTLASEIINGSTGVCTITTKTYNGSTYIGETQVSLTLEVPNTVVPSVTIGTITEADTTMQSLGWGIFVQNKSKLNIPITATGIYGSTIQSIVTTINGVNFTGTPVITSTLVTAGTNTITTTVTDSRGMTATDTATYSVVAYSNPNIQIAQAQRCLSDGTLSDNGTYLLYGFKGTISPVSNNNTASYRLGYKRTSASTYTYINISTNYDIDLSNQISSFTIDADYPYDIKFEAIDAFMTSSIDRDIDTGFDLLNFNASGMAMAIGKVSEASGNQELLEIDLPMQVTQPITSDSSITTTSTITATGNITTSGKVTATNYEGKWDGYTNDLSTSNTTNNDVLVLNNTNLQKRMCLFPYILYDDDTGSNTSVALSETSANFTYMDIIYRTNDNCYSSVKVYEPNGKRISMLGQYCSSSEVWWKLAVWNISGTTLSYGSSAEIDMTSSNSISGTNNIFVTQVIGWK